MKQVKLFAITLAMASALITGCDKDDNSYDAPVQAVIQSTIVKVSGDSAAVAAKLTEFRVLLGDPLNSAPNQTTGRREVNWDGAPAAVTNNNTFPFDFFNNTDPAGPNGRKRGLQYVNNGTLLRLDSSDFSEIDPSYAGQFEPFSKKKMIIPVGANVSVISFKVPGTTTDASVKGFGVVLSDVDDANSTYIEFYNGVKSLGVFKAPATAGTAKYSFLGVFFPVEKITHLVLTAGNAALANGVKDVTDGGTKDLVAIDDFLYSEPVIIN
ncbi:MAG TPA: hypothetical protein VIZ28_05935 [Chitinophagaceae bacterium]